MRTAPPAWRGVIAEYRERLPVSDETPVISLGEGGTPLLRSTRLSQEVGAEVHLKFEGANPTGSFKDRGMTVAVSRALEDGARAVACASTGNTSASASAYAARAGLRCAVVVPQGGVAVGKMAQTLVAGAMAFEVDGSFDEALRVTRSLAESYPVTLVNSVNPDRLQGQKTCVFEICDQLGGPPDLHLIPVGNAGNITSHWMGYREYHRDGVIDSVPRLFGFQAAGAAPIVEGHPVARPTTVASAIRIGNPASWQSAEEAARESDGAILAVPDDDILRAYADLAAEGLFAEPASAISVAGLRRLAADGRVPRGVTAVCVLTGHGLKDPEAALGRTTRPVPIAPDPDILAAALGLR